MAQATLESRVEDLETLVRNLMKDVNKKSFNDVKLSVLTELESENRTLKERNLELIMVNAELANSVADITFNDAITITKKHQDEVVTWNKKNFGEHFPKQAINFMAYLRKRNKDIPEVLSEENRGIVFQLEKSVGYRLLLGMTEELGEICHVHLKREQGIRIGTDPEACAEKIKDGIGDLLIYMMNYADSQGLDIVRCFHYAWDQIKQRDWKKNVLDGKELDEKLKWFKDKRSGTGEAKEL